MNLVDETKFTITYYRSKNEDMEQSFDESDVEDDDPEEFNPEDLDAMKDSNEKYEFEVECVSKENENLIVTFSTSCNGEFEVTVENEFMKVTTPIGEFTTYDDNYVGGNEFTREDGSVEVSVTVPKKSTLCKNLKKLLSYCKPDNDDGSFFNDEED